MKVINKIDIGMRTQPTDTKSIIDNVTFNSKNGISDHNVIILEFIKQLERVKDTNRKIK